MTKLRQKLDRRTVLLWGGWVLYVLVFAPLYRLMGPTVAALAILPTLATGWRFGMVGGISAGILAFPLNVLLLVLADGSPGSLMNTGGIVGSALLVVEGAVVGRLRDVSKQMKQALTARRRTKEALQRQNRELRALNAVSQALSSSLELEKALEEALSSTVDMLGVSGGLVSLFDEQTEDLRLIAHAGLPEPLVEHLRTEGMEGTPCPRVYREGRPLSVEDLQGEASIEIEELLDMDVCSYIGTPIIHRGETLGTLCLFDTTPHSFDGSVPDLLIAIGQQIGVAVENARHLRDAVHEREIARTLLETSEILGTTLRFEQLLERTLDALRQMVSYDRAAICLLQGDRCQIAASRGRQHSPDVFGFALEDRPQVQRVVHQRRPVIVSDTRGGSIPAADGQLAPPCSWLGVPLIVRDEVIGVLTMGARTSDAYDEEDSRMIASFAHQAAMAIENSRLYEQTRSQLREAATLQGVTAAISSTLDIDRVLPYVARSLCGMLNATSVEIFRLEEGEEVATLVADYAAREAVDAERQLETGRTESLHELPAAAEAVAQDRVLQIRMSDPDLDPRQRGKLESRRAQAMLLLPLAIRGHASGFVRIWDSTLARRFTQGEIAMAQTVIHQTAIAMENARLIEETQHRARQLAGAAEVARHAAAVMDRERLLKVAVDLIQEQFGFHLAGVFLMDEVANELYAAAATEDFQEIIPDGYRQSVGEGAIGAAAATGETIHIADTSSGLVPYQAEAWLPSSSLSVPIEIGGMTIGVLEAGDSDPNAFDESDQRALEVIADQIAIAYQNAELLTETRSRMKELQLLHDVSLAAASSTHLEETLQAAAEALAAEWEGTRIALQLIDRESETLRIKASAGYPHDQFEAFALPLGEGITGWVAQHGEPALVPDVREDPRYSEADPGVRSELCVPLSVGNLVIGTLNVESLDRDAFTTDDQRLLSTLAGNLAVLVERARLFEDIESARAELQQRAEALERANERLKELDRLKSQFLSTITHELRTPLNSVIGFSEIMMDGLVGELTPDQKSCVRDILTSGEHLMALINNILDFSKIEAGHIELDLETFDVSELIDEVQTTISPMVESESQMLNVELEEDLPPLTADRTRIRQVLLNLLSNAHKFTPAEGEITLSCHLADPSAIRDVVLRGGHRDWHQAG